MARITICGFLGFGNNGDGGILAAITDTLGYDHEYIVSINLPFDRYESYRKKLEWSLPMGTEVEIRGLEDMRSDYDLLLFGGGRLHWGWGWQKAMSAMKADIPVVAYGVELEQSGPSYHRKLDPVYAEFLNHFAAVTVRDMATQSLLYDIGVPSTLTMCPAVNLKEERFDCHEGLVAVCPRYWDGANFKANLRQVDWLAERAEKMGGKALLIAFGPVDLEGKDVDLALCKDLERRLPDAEILQVSGYEPRKVKYAISKSRMVLSGGRYHALVWAAAHGVPWEAYPESVNAYPKIRGFIDVCSYKDFKPEMLLKMERKNGEILRGIMEEHNIE